MRPALAALLLALAASACSHGTPVDRSGGEDRGTGQLSGCHGKASATIPSDGLYDLTTFGGPGDSQPVACGGSTDDGSWYYVASSQRFGCGARLRIEANGRCVIAQVADYGPDVCVENAAGRPIIDASPKVARLLFGSSSSELGWSDRVLVHAVVTDPSAPLGACATSSTTSSSSVASSSAVTTGSGSGGAGGGEGGSGGAGASGTGGTSVSSSAASGGGTPCASDGDCNPGNDGSGKICTNHVCVPGCHHDYQCPGITTCVGGFCQ